MIFTPGGNCQPAEMFIKFIMGILLPLIYIRVMSEKSIM